MRKRISLQYIVLPVILIALSIFGAWLWSGHRKEMQAVKAFKQSGGEIVAIFNEQLKEEDLSVLLASLSVPVKVVRHIEDYALISTEDPEKYQTALKELESNSAVKAVQANSEISAMRLSSDTYADSQWALNNPGSYYTYLKAAKTQIKSTVDVDMNIPEAWEFLKNANLGKREVVIAIIDTGVDNRHPDLAGHFWENAGEIPEDGIDNDNNGYVDDIHGWDFYNEDNTICHYKYNDRYQLYLADPKDNDDHGTHIAGIISATADNNIGIAGIATGVKVKLMILKINGGTDGTGNLSSAVEAVKYATRMGADICNLSWGTYQYTAALKEVMSESDILFVAASGNTGENNDEKPIYPASLELPNLISVTFVDADGRLTDLSNYGSRTVDIAAPGADIYSTVVGSYATMSGSSMAAPQVSAVAALLYSLGDFTYPSNIKQLILDNNKSIPELEGMLINPGIPDAFRTVSAAMNGLRGDCVEPVIGLKTVYDKGVLRIPVNITEEGGSGVRVIKWLSGSKTLADFNHGTEGTTVKDNSAELDRAGVYTFYAGDYAGNEASTVYEVIDDVTPPKISASYSVSNYYKTRTVVIDVTDAQSKVKRVKYMSGSKTAADFLPAGAGTEISLTDGKGSFKVANDGIYSIFAMDYRGNTYVRRISVKTVKTTELRLSRTTRTMAIREKYSLLTYVKPVNTTDRIIFTSSDKSIATVTTNGIIKALKAGTVTITVKTSSGLKATCRVTVK